MSAIRLIIADDHFLFRKCLQALVRRAPEIEIVGEAANGVEAVQRSVELRPDVILLDLMMPHLNGLAAISLIKQEVPEAKILVLTSCDSDDEIFPALKAGALGYMLKDATPDELLTAIRAVSLGKSYLHPPIASKVLNQLYRPSETVHMPNQLTKRQQEVLTLMAQGCSNLEIADRLCIAETTASKHVSGILGKLHLTSRVQAALYATRQT